MTTAAPAVLALETDSAWVVILAVSLVTLAAALLLRRLINRPGGLLSGVLLGLPLVLPLVAALFYEHALLPEIAVLRPAGSALVDRSGSLFHLLLFQDQATHTVTPYALSGSAGPWILLAGGLVTSFMLVRRVVGVLLVRRLIARSRPLDDDHLEVVGPALEETVRLSSLAKMPGVLVLPDGVQGAFAVGGRKGRILVSEAVIFDLDREELEGVLAHEVAHLETHDVRVVFAAGLLRDLVAWNPLAHVAYRRLASDREREADRRAATLTARPLAVASGLLKMYELMRSQPRALDQGAMAFLRPGRQISRRVSHLIALADGRTLAAPSGRVPYLMAGLLVAVLGLQVGAHVATQDMNGFAIVLGDTSSNNAEFWTPTEIRKHHKTVNGRHHVAAERGAAKKEGKPTPRYPELTREVLVKEKNLPAWFEWMARRAEGISRSSLKWDLRREWQAVPVFSQPAGGPLTIYRLGPPGT
ncbi:MAG TPA: M56 family metallopeptidase [Actinomycetota bacterium]|nr:M56 family metallopeptidase [Actinomycetota bacterium]